MQLTENSLNGFCRSANIKKLQIHRRSQTEQLCPSQLESSISLAKRTLQNMQAINSIRILSNCSNLLKKTTISHMNANMPKERKNMSNKIQDTCFRLVLKDSLKQPKQASKMRKVSVKYQFSESTPRLASSIKKLKDYCMDKEKRRKNLSSRYTKGKNMLSERERMKEEYKNAENMRELTEKLKYSDFDIDSWKLEIRKTCMLMEELRNFGITDKKLNNWCKIYFDGKKKGLIDAFMKKSFKKKSLNNEIVFNVVQNQETLLARVVDLACQIPENEIYFLGIEISLYRNFLQQKIANKHMLQMNQIQNRVQCNIQQAETKQLARELYQNQSTSVQTLTFFNDFQRLEETFGRFNMVSLKNRRRFENINKSQVNIRKLIYD